MAGVSELRQDVQELETLLAQAARPRVKDMLALNIRKIQTEITDKVEKEKAKTDSSHLGDGDAKSAPVSKPRATRVTSTITNYAWDQSEKFMKIYLLLNGIHNIPVENVTCTFTDSSFRLHISDFEGKDHVLHVARLFNNITQEGSYYKVKTDKILVMLKKTEPNKTWAYVTKKEDKKEKKPPGMDKDKDKDPQDGLMDLMKQMYDDGDDEMKRTIAKAWTESREKQGQGAAPMDL